MERLIVRRPTGDDVTLALKDLVTLRTAPPLVVSLALLIVLTGNLVLAVLGVLLTSYVHALWARLVVPTEP